MTEKAEFLGSLARGRVLLRRTVQGLTDEQAARRTTVSALCLSGLIKHVTAAEEGWIDFVEIGTAAKKGYTEEAIAEHAETFRVGPGETLAGLLERYEEVARRTEKVITGLPGLDVGHRLPDAPWYPARAMWSARQVLLHIIAETRQHAGHADILRETLDGQQTMA